MSQQIAIRLPDDLVAYLDDAVRAGTASSRAAFVTKALERERQRTGANRDAKILAESGGYPDLDALVNHAFGDALDID